MKIGGYQIINLKGKNLTTGVGMVYDGLYELIEGTRKPILLSGIQIDDTEYQDVFAELSVNDSNLELRAYNKVFTIQDNNVVVVTDDENGGGGDTSEKIIIYLNDVPIAVYKDTVVNNVLKLGNFLRLNEDFFDDALILPFTYYENSSVWGIETPMNDTPVRAYSITGRSFRTLRFKDTGGIVNFDDVFEDGMEITANRDV